MAQTRQHDYRAEATSESHNWRWLQAFGNLVLHGFDVEPGTSGLKITLKSGSGLIGGLTFRETDDQVDILELDTAHGSQPRVDALVAEYDYAQTLPPPTVSYSIVKGPLGGALPSLTGSQLLLAHFAVEPALSILTQGHILLPGKARPRIRAMVNMAVLAEREQPFYLEGAVWMRTTDPADDASIDLKTGDFWVDTSEAPSPGVYKRRSDSTWEDIQGWANLRGAPSNFPPSVHHLDGSEHTGTLHINRVRGHNERQKDHLHAAILAMVMGEL